MIVGAGASVDFGMPLGGELIEFLSHKILNKDWWDKTTFYGEDTCRVPPEATNYLNDLPAGKKNDAFAALAWKHDADSFKKDSSRTIELGHLLKNQTSETIDDFISLNSGYASLAKLFVASDFANRLYDWSLEERIFKLKSLSQRHLLRTPIEWDEQAQNFTEKKDENGKPIVLRERNWIHLLINIIRHGINKNGPPKEKIRIISFNYDGILEKVLSDQFMNTESLLDEQKNHGRTYRDYIEIIHPHGFCGELEETPPNNNPWKLAESWAQQISVVNERHTAVTPKVSLARAAAKLWIKEAPQIYAAGFAFSKPNCDDILGLSENYNCVLSYLNFNDDIGLDLGVKNNVHHIVWEDKDHPVQPKIVRAAGTKDRPLSIANWIRAGHLGELPG